MVEVREERRSICVVWNGHELAVSQCSLIDCCGQSFFLGGTEFDKRRTLDREIEDLDAFYPVCRWVSAFPHPVSFSLSPLPSFSSCLAHSGFADHWKELGTCPPLLLTTAACHPPIFARFRLCDISVSLSILILSSLFFTLSLSSPSHCSPRHLLSIVITMASSRRRSSRLKEKEEHDTVLSVRDIVTELSLEFNIPITISQDPNDQPTIEDVIEIYAREGMERWDNKTRFAFAKALPLIKTTPSSQTVPSNHGIWRAVMHRKEGWNWAYWIIFRTIYGKNILQDRVRVVNAVKKTFPGTDIWSASTPAPVVHASSPASPASEKILASITVASTAIEDPTAAAFTAPSSLTHKRKHPDDVPATDPLRFKRPAIESCNSYASGESAQESNVNVADVTNLADPTQNYDETQEQQVVQSETPGDAEGPTVTATESLPAAKPTNRLATLEHTHLYRQVRDELSAQSAEIQKMNERISKQAQANDYVGQLFEDIRDIKRRLDASMPPPSGFNGHSLHVALEALGHQVDYCTRNIYELKTGQPYEDDPALLCIKRERVGESDFST